MADPPDSALSRPKLGPPRVLAPAPPGGHATAAGPVAAPLGRAQRPPLVLLVGEGEATADALAASLKQRGLGVMMSPAERAAAAAVARAPDLVMLIGDAAHEGGQRVIKTLAGRATTARLPVAVLEDGDAASLDRRLRALRSGAIAVIERQASVDAMASRIGDLAWRVADHTTRTAAGVEVTLDELTAVIRKELGLLVPDDEGQPVAAPGREMAEAIQVFVERIRALVQRGDVEGARAALAARPSAMKLDSSMLADLDDGATLALRGARVLLVHDDPGRADALAQELRARGSMVVVSGRSERGLAGGRELDPEVVLLDSSCILGPGLDVAKALARDARLRWAAVLTMSWDEIWPAGAGVPRMSVIAARVAPHRVPEREIADRVVEDAHFDLEVERVGPPRVLRALALAPHVLGVTAPEDSMHVRVDLADGLVAGATADGLEGLPALAHLLGLSTGVLRIERRRAPNTANILLPVADALTMAGREHVSSGLAAPAAAAADTDAPRDSTEHAPLPVAELDAPFAADARVASSGGDDLAEGDSDTDATEVTLRGARPVPPLAPVEPFARRAPPHDSGAGGLAALLEPDTAAPAARAEPRPRVGTPDYASPRSDAPIAKRVPRNATLVGVVPPPGTSAALAAAVAHDRASKPPAGASPLTHAVEAAASAAGASESVAGTPAARVAAPPAASVEATRAELARLDARVAAAEPTEPQVAAPASAAPAPLGAEVALAPRGGAFPAPTPAGPLRARRSKLPIVVVCGMLLFGVGALVAWRVAGPILTARHAAEPIVRRAPRTTPSTRLVPSAPATRAARIKPPPAPAQAQIGATPVLPPPQGVPPTSVAPIRPAIVGVTAPSTPDAGPANAPALAAVEAQTLASALDHALAAAEADPDAESERLTDEAAGVTDPGRAATLLVRAIELSARNPHPVEALARLYLRNGNAEGAVEWASKLVVLRRRRASARVLLGDARRAAGDEAGAQGAYREALEIAPDDADAVQRVGQ